MKLAEKILIVIAVIGLTFKMFHLPCAGIILTVSLMSLSMFYMICSYFLYKDFEKKSNVLSVISGLFLSMLLIGILFKLMHWPGSAIVTSVSIISLIMIFFVALILFFTANNNKKYYKKVFVRVGIWLLVIMFLFSLGTNLIKNQHHSNDSDIEMLHTIKNIDIPTKEGDTVEYHRIGQDSLLVISKQDTFRVKIEKNN